MIEPTINKTTIESQIYNLIEQLFNQNKSEWTEGRDWVRYAGSFFDAAEYKAGVQSLLSGWLGLGDSGIRFERKFCKLMDKGFGALVNSGSSANLLMVSALKSKRLWNLPKGSKIITPVAGFPTTVNPILQNGFKPVFVDIDIDGLNMNLRQVEDAAKKGAKAIIFAHVLGNPPDMDWLMSIVKNYDLILLEDCCDALGSTFDKRPLGSFGDMASCSFYPAHHMTMGEGGFVACRSETCAEVVKSLREWGRGCYCTGQGSSCLKNGMCKKRFSNWLPAFPDDVFDHKYIYEEIGYNLKPLDLQAAIGLVQLEKLEFFAQRRQRNFARLMDIFSKYDSVFHLPRATSKSDPSWFAFPLTIRDGVYLKRSHFTMYLEDNRIQTRNYFGGNLLLQPAYSDLAKTCDPKKKYPNATKATRDTFFVGTSQVVDDRQLDYVQKVVDAYFERAANIRV